jgi:hypothetical protein
LLQALGRSIEVHVMDEALIEASIVWLGRQAKSHPAGNDASR